MLSSIVMIAKITPVNSSHLICTVHCKLFWKILRGSQIFQTIPSGGVAAKSVYCVATFFSQQYGLRSVFLYRLTSSPSLLVSFTCCMGGCRIEAWLCSTMHKTLWESTTLAIDMNTVELPQLRAKGLTMKPETRQCTQHVTKEQWCGARFCYSEYSGLCMTSVWWVILPGMLTKIMSHVLCSIEPGLFLLKNY